MSYNRQSGAYSYSATCFCPRCQHQTMRLALCDIEGGVAGSLDEAKQIASRAVAATTPAAQ